MHHEPVDQLLAAINTFNVDHDLSAFGALLADGCTYDNHGSSGGEIRQALLRQAGSRWIAHQPISVATRGDLVVTIARNSFRDGSTALIGNVYQFDSNGLVQRIVSLEGTDIEY